MGNPRSCNEKLSRGISPRFPVETQGADGLHAALLKESRTRGPASSAVDPGSPIFFGPRIPDFPVEVGGAEQDHAAFFERKPQTRSWLVLRSRNPATLVRIGHPYGV